MTSDPREAKLPKWAIEELKRLRMRLSEATERERLAREETSLIGYGTEDLAPRAFVHDDRLVLLRKKGDVIGWTVAWNGDALEVNTGGDTAQIEPRSSNHFRVTPMVRS